MKDSTKEGDLWRVPKNSATSFAEPLNVMTWSWSFIFDYKTDNRGEPVELAEWLKDNRDNLDDMKILYVIKPNRDELLKFGIAGAREGGTSAYGRLRQYLNIYGKQDVNFPCLGVNLYYIFGNKYAKDVQTTNTYVFKKRNVP